MDEHGRARRPATPFSRAQGRCAPWPRNSRSSPPRWFFGWWQPFWRMIFARIRSTPARGCCCYVIVMLLAAAISRFTIRLLARPLSQLQAGITSARNGRLEPIQVSRTGDEVEFLGESFNGMIEALAASQEGAAGAAGIAREENQGPYRSTGRSHAQRRRRPARPRASSWPICRTSCGPR